MKVSADDGVRRAGMVTADVCNADKDMERGEVGEWKEIQG